MTTTLRTRRAAPIDADVDDILGLSVDHLARSFFARAKPQPLRTMRQWFEEMVVIPSGPCRGEPWSADRQPVQALLLDLMDGGEFTEFITVGPSQTGKSLLGYIGPVLYHAAEMRETVVLGLPASGQKMDKWNDITEILSASASLKSLIPVKGAGSKGGAVRDVVYLTNNTRLRLMTVGGKDTARAGYTSRVVAVTEMADFSTSSRTSFEADPYRQLLARQRSYDADKRRTYAEGTVTTEAQYPWAARIGAAIANIKMPCAHCGDYVSLERENLRDFSDAADEQEARENTHLACPSCDGRIDDEQRRAMVRLAVVVFDGQSIDRAGRITGDRPRSKRVWFRYNAAHNLLVSIGEVGVEEWRALQHPEDSKQRFEAETQLSQQLWAIPIKPKQAIGQDVDPEKIATRKAATPRGVLPRGVQYLACGVDVGASKLHLTTLAVTAEDQILVVEHRVELTEYEPGGSGLDAPTAVRLALRELRDELLAGYVELGSGRVVVPNRVVVDNSWETETIRSWCAETAVEFKDRVLVVRGKGSNSMAGKYRCPAQSNRLTVEIAGDQSYYVVLAGEQHMVPEVNSNADLWKLRVQAAALAPQNAPGSMLLYHAPAKEHAPFCRSLFSERQVTEFLPGKGEVTRMLPPTKANHHLDSTSYAMVGLALAGWDYVEAQAAAVEHAAAVKALATTKEDGKTSEAEREFIRARSAPPPSTVAPRNRTSDDDDVIDLSTWGDSASGGYDSDPHAHLF